MDALALPWSSQRLVVRRLEERDRGAHESMFTDPTVRRFLYDDAMDEVEMRSHFDRRLASDEPSEDGWLNLAVDVEGVVVGELGVHVASAAHRDFEIGYVFAPAHCGRGLATEATRLLVAQVFERWGAHRVHARLDARNLRSAALLSRLGMRREAHFVRNEFVKGEWTDEFVYAILEEEWLARD